MTKAYEVEWEWEDEGFREILNCDELQEVVLKSAEEIADKAMELSTCSSLYDRDGGPIFYAREGKRKSAAKGRVSAKVHAGNWQARQIESKHKVLSKAANQTKK